MMNKTTNPSAEYSVIKQNEVVVAQSFMLYVERVAKRQMHIFVNKFYSENGCSGGSTTLGTRVSSATRSIED